MKKTILLLSTTICMVSTVSFGMEVKPYIEGKISENWMKTEYSEPGFPNEKFDDNVLGGSLSVGLKMNKNYRVELEGYYNNKMEDTYTFTYGGVGYGFPVEFKSKGFFLNGYYDIDLPNTTKVKPYIGGGIGYSWLEAKMKFSSYGLSDEGGKDEDIGYNIGLGVSYELNQNTDLTLGYRYEYLGKMKENGADIKFKNNKVSLGLRYTF